MTWIFFYFVSCKVLQECLLSLYKLCKNFAKRSECTDYSISKTTLRRIANFSHPQRFLQFLNPLPDQEKFFDWFFFLSNLSKTGQNSIFGHSMKSFYETSSFTRFLSNLVYTLHTLIAKKQTLTTSVFNSPPPKFSKILRNKMEGKN